jgi:putative endopeptidase
MDTTVKPGDDIFEYANGGWIKRNPIPADQSSWGIGNLVIEENLKRLREISEKSAAAKGANGSDEQKIGDFWSHMEWIAPKIDADGLKPLQSYQLDKINAINDVKSLVATVADLKKIGSSTLFADFVTQDDKNSEVMTYKLWQGGLGLPEREYYFKNRQQPLHNIRSEYLKYIADVLTMSGDESIEAASAAKNILALETKLAKASQQD